MYATSGCKCYNDNMEQIIRQFTKETVDEIKVIPGGHINESFLITGAGKYVLQRLNASLYKNSLNILTSNYLSYRSACGGRRSSFEWNCPEWRKTKSGEYFYSDEKGGIWRMYEFIPGEIMTGKETETDAFSIGEGVGRLHGILRTIPPSEITGVFPHLHDGSYYYEEYVKCAKCRTDRDDKLDRIIRKKAEEMLTPYPGRRSIIHADAKVANMIFRQGKVVAFIDLDTMTEGSVFDDLADCMRASCVDENANLMKERIKELLDGYEEGAGVKLSGEEKEFARVNVLKNRFMLGLRYYTDYLSKAGYFREEYPGENLYKARRLLQE